MSSSNNLCEFGYFKFVISDGVIKTGDSHIQLVGIVLDFFSHTGFHSPSNVYASCS